MTRCAAAFLCLLIPGCAQVEILRRPSDDAAGLKHVYTARTFFYSNNMEVPRKRMLGPPRSFASFPSKALKTE